MEIEKAVKRIKEIDNDGSVYFHVTENGYEWLDKDKNVIAEYKNGRMIRYESTIKSTTKS
jgi:hypothetical protein